MSQTEAADQKASVRIELDTILKEARDKVAVLADGLGRRLDPGGHLDRAARQRPLKASNRPMENARQFGGDDELAGFLKATLQRFVGGADRLALVELARHFDDDHTAHDRLGRLFELRLEVGGPEDRRANDLTDDRAVLDIDV